HVTGVQTCALPICLGYPLLVEGVTPLVLPGGELGTLEHPLWPPLQGGGAVPQGAHDPVRHRQVVVEHVPLGEPTGREVDLVGVAQPHRPAGDLNLLRVGTHAPDPTRAYASPRRTTRQARPAQRYRRSHEAD